MSLIRIKDDQFELSTYKEMENDTTLAHRPYFMRTSFCLLGHYQAGNRNKAREWLDRIKEQGFDGPRVFGENENWFIDNEEAKFFGNPKYTTHTVAWGNTNARGGASSKIKLIPGYIGYVSELSEDLLERDMVAEFCTNATAKTWVNSGWSSHGANKFSQLFAELFPDPQRTPFLHETINEADAHTHRSWADKDGLTDEGRSELKRMGPRWRRSSSDPGHRNYPGSTIGVSAGGQYSPGFDDTGYTHRNIHPPRGNKWDVGPDGEDIGSFFQSVLRNKSQGRPIAFNETIHYMTPEQWDEWIPIIPKWAGLSTKEASRCLDYYERLLKAGCSVCVHDMNGMGTWPDAPLSHLEKRMVEIYGDGTVDSQPHEDHPEHPTTQGFDPFSVKAYRDAVERSYLEILQRKPDPEGWREWCLQLHRGVSEARMREVMMRSPEFEERYIKK